MGEGKDDHHVGEGKDDHHGGEGQDDHHERMLNEHNFLIGVSI